MSESNDYDDIILQNVKRFEEMLKTNEVYFFDSDEYASIARYYLDTGNTSKAEKALSLGLEQYPDNTNLQVVQSEIMILHGKLDEAVEKLEYLHSMDPDNSELLYQLASALSKSGNHRDAINALLSIPGNPDFSYADVTFMLGNEYLMLEEYDKAIEYFTRTLEIDPEDNTALYNLVYCYETQKEHEACIGFLKDFIDRQPYNEVAWHQLGKQYAYLDNDNEALRAFDYAILIDEGFAGAYIEIAKIYEKKELYHKALEYYLITEQLSEPSPFIYKHIASCYNKLGLYKKEIDYLFKVHESDPTDENTILLLADKHFRMGKTRQSLYFLDKLLQLESNNPEYWKIYADTNFKIRFYPEAIKGYNKYLSFNKQSLTIYLHLADSYLLTGQLYEALNILGKAEVYYHNRAEIYYRIAGIQMLMGKKAYGLAYFNKALHINFSMLNTFERMFPKLYKSKEINRLINEYARL